MGQVIRMTKPTGGEQVLRVQDRFESMYMTPRALTSHPAYKTLPLAAFRLLHHFLDDHDGTNNGRMGMTVQQAMAVTGTSKPTAIAALRTLRSRGLILRTHSAARSLPGRGDKDDHTTYLLTCYSYVSGGRTIKPRDDWQAWTEGQDFSSLEDRILLRPDASPKITGVLSRRAAADARRQARAEADRERAARPVEIPEPLDHDYGDDIAY